MSADRELHPNPEAPDMSEDKETMALSLLDLMMQDALADLDDIEEPTAADLAALDAMEENDPVPDRQPAAQPALSLLAKLEEPELVSLESLETKGDIEVLEDELLEEDDFPDELLDNYIDIDLDDDELDDEGYDLDDEDIVHYQDLYGEDADIIPSFREGELDDEDESGIAYYDDLR